MDRNDTTEDHAFDTGNIVNTLKQQKPNIVKPEGTMHYGTTGTQFGFGTFPAFIIEEGLSLGNYTEKKRTKKKFNVDVCLSFLK
eukprot:9032961-Ditylum_brightwellii.AAC.1